MLTLIGTAAGLLTTGCLIPQVVKTQRSGSTSDFSFLYLAAMDVGLCLWLVYGVCLFSVPIIVSNSVSAALVSYLVAAKARQRTAARPQRPAGAMGETD